MTTNTETSVFYFRAVCHYSHGRIQGFTLMKFGTTSWNNLRYKSVSDKANKNNDFNKELNHSPFHGQLLTIVQFHKFIPNEISQSCDWGPNLDYAWANAIRYIFTHYCYYQCYTVILACDLRSALFGDIKQRRVVHSDLTFRDNLSVPTSP